ncbi:Ig-like domain-containing protein [Sphingobacterium sp. 1.A.5]|jgi:hypothetical protein|uniref:Ig-like domain-containing protein n=1 Tax=Sphingobacterium sp. 1.A.5 TaxID=2044604 RepID=UPI000C0BD30F|nr:Ig-like domain-containing protein [Sphingobacterium sp. 1.A.5]
MYKFKYTISAVLVLAFFLFTTCTKKGLGDDPDGPEGPDGPDKPNSKNEVTISKSSGLPGEAIELKFDFKLEKERYPIKFGTESIEVIRLADSTGVIYIPPVAPKEYFIDLQGVKANLQVPFEVSQYSFSTSESVLKQEIYGLTGGLFSDQTRFKSMQQKFEEGLQKMNQEDRNIYLHVYRNLIKQTLNEQESAKFSNLGFNDIAKIAVRENLNLPLIAKANNMSYLKAFNTMLEDDYEALFMKPAVKYSNIMKGIVIWALGHVIVTEATSIAGRIWGPVAVIAGTTISIGGAIVIMGLIDNAIAAVKLLYSNIAIVFTEDFSDTKMQADRSHTKANTNPPEQKMDFKVGKPLESNIKFNFYSFSILMKDKTQSSILNSMLEIYERVLPPYTKVYSLGDRVLSFFQIKDVFVKPESLIPQSSNSAERNVRSSQIRIENISNTNIQINHKDGAQGIIFEATATGISQKVDFTFDIVFEQPLIGIMAKKHIKATYDGEVKAEALKVYGGNLQFGKPGVELDNEISAKLTDVLGNPAPNYKIKWKIDDGGGRLQRAESTTDENGIATNKWTLGTTSQQRVEASFLTKDGTEVNVIFNALWDLNGTWNAKSIYFTEDHKNWKGDWLKQVFADQKIEYFTMIVENNNTYTFKDAVLGRDLDNNPKVFEKITPSSRLIIGSAEDKIRLNFQALGGSGPAILKYITPNKIQINFDALKGFGTRWHYDRSTTIPYWWTEEIILEKQP